MKELADVQGGSPKHYLSIGKVGVRNVRVPLNIKRGDNVNHILADIESYVDLPPGRKGADMSRAVESINSIALDRKDEISIENVTLEIARDSLKRFTYSEKCNVSLKTELFAEKTSGSGRKSFVSYNLESSTVLHRGGNLRQKIGVEFMGMNACPCAMESARSIISDSHPEAEEFLTKIPIITHNQRNRVRISLETDGEIQVEALRLIEIGESVVNGSLLPVLKRRDEGELVVSAHMNPMFVEDIVREIASRLLKEMGIRDGTIVSISSESYESIHPHNAYAQIESTAGDLRKSILNGSIDN